MISQRQFKIVKEFNLGTFLKFYFKKEEKSKRVCIDSRLDVLERFQLRLTTSLNCGG